MKAVIYSVMTLSVYTCVCGFDDRVSILCLMQTNMVEVKRRTTSCDYSKGHKQGERDIIMTQRERESRCNKANAAEIQFATCKNIQGFTYENIIPNTNEYFARTHIHERQYHDIRGQITVTQSNNVVNDFIHKRND